MSHNDFEYKYPKFGNKRVNLKPDSDLHNKLVEEANQRIRAGRSAGEAGRARARELDRTLQNFVPLEKAEEILRFKNSSRPAAPLDMVIPISKAACDVWVTFMASIFLSDPRGPYMIEGRGGKESVVRSRLLERLLNSQSLWFGHDAKHLTFWRDCYAYGLGCLVPVWSKHKRRQPIVEEIGEVLLEMLRGEIPGLREGDIIKLLEERVVHEGSSLHNVDYYSLILDPSVSITEHHKMEYVGYMEHENVLDMLGREDDEEEHLFNVKYLREHIKGGGGGSRYRDTMRPDDERAFLPTGSQEKTACDVTHLFWRLIPKEYGLGSRETPELFHLKIGADEIIVGLRSIDYDHGQLPMIFGAPHTTGYDTFPVSALASMYGGQAYCNWKIRAQIANQMKVLNDMIMIDTSVFNEGDLLQPEPGKLIRTRRPIMGMGGLDQFVKQLNVHDVTANNLNDLQNMMQLTYQNMGLNDTVMGTMEGLPERPTAQGLMAARNSALSRLQKDAQVLVSQMWYKLIHQLCSNTMQYMDEDVMLTVVGSRYEKELRDDLGLSPDETEVMFTPWDLDLDYDVQPINKFQSDANLAGMSMLVDRLLSHPELAQQAFMGFDVGGLMNQFMQKSGFENIHQYMIDMPTVMPDEQLLAQVDAGNMVPADQVF